MYSMPAYFPLHFSGFLQHQSPPMIAYLVAMTAFFDRPEWPRRLGWLILLLGILVRLKVYGQNRSLFLDEANLSRNVVERVWGEFFRALDYQQYAPPGYLMLNKLSVLLIGTGEYSLRLIPLLSSIGLLFIVYALAKKLIASRWVQLVPLFLTAFSYEMIRYGTENKQYSLDALLTVLLVALALQWTPKELTRGRVFLWSLLGALAVWFSMPIVFTLAGIGLYYGHAFLRKQEYRQLGMLILTIGSWLLSFGVYYWLLLRPDIESDYLNTYHQAYFLPLPPQSTGDWEQLGRLLLSLVHNTVGFTVVAYVVGGAALLWGMMVLGRRHFGRLILLGIPVLACLLASALEQYSLLPRLTLFFTPLLALMMAVGTDHLWRYRSWTPWLCLALWLPVLPLKGGLYYLYAPFEVENTREVLRVAQEAEAGALVYVHHEAVPAAVYYRDYHPDSLAFRQKPMYLSQWEETPNILRSKDYTSFWTVYSHLINDHTRSEMKEQVNRLDTWTEQREEISATGARALRWKKE